MISALDQLSAQQKRELLERLLRERKGREAAIYPLSHGQRALWFLHRLAPDMATHHVAFAARVRSRVNAAAFGRALGSLVERHGALRTRFREFEGTPVQEILPRVNLSLDQIDVSGLDEDAIRARVEAAYARPFDLERAPLLRAQLFSRAEDDHVLLLTVHHAVADYWSVVVLVKDLLELYAAQSENRPPALPEPPPPFVDHVHESNARIAGPEGQRAWEYWRDALAGDPQPIRFAGERSDTASRAWTGGTHRFNIGAQCTERLRELARKEGVTPFVVLLAAFYVLLGRHTGADDLVVGSLAAGRTRARFRNTVGYFVNPIALRVRLEGDPTFRELLVRTQETTLGALRHQDFPFALLIERLNPKRHARNGVLFRTLFLLQNLPVGEPAAALVVGRPGARAQEGGLEFEAFPLAQQEGEFELELEVTSFSDALACAIKYRTDVFSAEDADRLGRHYTRLLAAIAENPDQPVSELAMLESDEIRQQLVEWNGTDGPLPIGRRVTDWLQDHATAQPDRLAVTEQGGALSYAELSARVQRTAGRLGAMGVGPETLVALYAERGIDLLSALLAVHGAGGAFLALDPRHPLERNLALVKSSGASVLVLASQSRQAPALRTALGRTTVTDLTHLLADDGDLPRHAPHRGGVRDLAYVVFTSGSTGEPKGAMLETGGMLNHLLAKVEDLGLRPGDVVAQTASMTFDISVWQCLAAILAGGTTAIVDDEAALVPRRLLKCVEAFGVTVLELVPSILRLVVEDAASDEWARDTLGRLRCLLSTGEPLSAELCRQWFALRPGVPLVNAYGPTECSDDVTHAFIHEPPPATATRMPIGRPIRNTRLYVLGSRGELRPRGATGELFVGGAGVGRGYLGDRDRTNRAFVPDGFSDDAEARLYRTGDRARWLPDGSLELLGRTDEQVKVRGHRIEPGEIESALEAHPAVHAAAVALRRDGTGEPTLAAYIVSTETAPSSDELRAFLRARLPEAMVPQRYVRLDRLPTTFNGKIDRAALPAPEEAPATTCVAARTKTEKAIGAIWTEVLKRDSISIHDDFFDLGGHSLAITQIAFRIRERFQIDVPLVRIFEHPTVAELSAIIDELSLERDESVPAAVLPAPGNIQTAEPVGPDASAYVTFEERPLAERILRGELPPVEAASLSYFPDAMLASMGPDRKATIDRFFGGRPYVSSILETGLGRIGCLVLPRFASECYGDPEGLAADCRRALALAGELGAGVVSLGGILASATDYGRRIGSSDGIDGGPRLSTGHATTAAAVFLALSRLLHETGRDLRHERVAFVGLGSVGVASLRLMLQRLPHPASLILCEVYRRREALAALQTDIREVFGFSKNVRCLTSHREVNAEAYEASVVVGATNVPDVLDVSRLAPGTLLVDDSAPHCFSLSAAAQRLETQGDILFTEGGTLHCAEPFRSTCYFPAAAEHMLGVSRVQVRDTLDPREITGCVVSSLLSVRRPGLVPILGVPGPTECEAHLDTLVELSFSASPLRGRGDALGEVYAPSNDAVARFRSRFGDRM